MHVKLDAGRNGVAGSQVVSFVRLWAVQINAHSALTPSMPWKRNCRTAWRCVHTLQQRCGSGWRPADVELADPSLTETRLARRSPRRPACQGALI